MGAASAAPTMPAFGSTTPRARLRLTRRGRVVVTGLAALPLVLGVLVGVLSSGGAVAGIDGGASAMTFETVEVGAGDTLWGIAETIAPSSDPRDVIYEIMRLNGLDDAVVQPGQQLVLPAVG
ncbi:LysM peptidoglycan-binding domain-containing protein [Agromyces binzhouensis]|uniref:LysM peptidoglycan-binding domain-containing protein n=2 Tax=Agromyces binzhouensis TaxID=1817495 RepID=A0A4Q2JN78_9MICO|nr:LysM peptidoglycan-binding domain-containing protein [Agromyces binzhouensis]